MQADLIYDVGLHNGDDTAYYLHRGYRVVAIEANPELVARGRERFSTAIRQGRLTIVDVAVGSKEGVVPFWISSNPEYSSLEQSEAAKWGQSCRAVTVRARRFGNILAQHGVPCYLKIDIEGADHHCLEDLDPADPPRFLSFEKRRLEDLLAARRLGYRRFKLIAQEDLCQLMFVPRLAERSRSTRRSRLYSTVWRSLYRRFAGRRGDRGSGGSAPRERASGGHRVLPWLPHEGGRWAFPYGSSGPFGDETEGPWRTMEEVALTWLAFDLGHTGSTDPARDDWFDIHCALS